MVGLNIEIVINHGSVSLHQLGLQFCWSGSTRFWQNDGHEAESCVQYYCKRSKRDVLRVPAVRVEARDDVFREGDVGVTIDGDVVVVIEDNQLAEAPVTGEGRAFAGQALHVAAVAHDHRKHHVWI